MKECLIVIPARIGSTRFAKKPLKMLLGKSILQRTWEIAVSVLGPEQVVVATDDLEILSHVRLFSSEALAVMTSQKCQNGTERVAEVLSLPEFETYQYALNFQGDAILTPPWVLQALVAKVEEKKKKTTNFCLTPALNLTWRQLEEFHYWRTKGKTSGTFVVFNHKNKALYFSKYLLPYVRKEGELKKTEKTSPYWRHIGVYAYDREFLNCYTSFPLSTLEDLEQLEQLRALENDLEIEIISVDYKGKTHWSIDVPEDMSIAEEIIKKEGELVCSK